MIASPIATIELHFTSRARQGESLEALGGLITGGKLASEGRIGVRNGHSNGYYSRSCASHPENYPGPYGTPGPQVYSEAPRSPEPYFGPYGTPGPQIYSGPEVSPAPAPYSGPYAPQVYSGPTGRMRWMIGPQPYGL